MKIKTTAFLLVFLSCFCYANEGAYWRDAQIVRQGVKVKALSLTKPRLMKAWVMSIDLKTPGIGFVTTERAKEWGQAMPDYTNSVKIISTKRESTADFMMRKRNVGHKVEVAVNTAPWAPWCSPWNHKWADPERWVVSDGVEVCAGKMPGKGALFVVYKDGKVEITSEVAKKDSVLHVHPGFEIIATNSVALAKRKLKDLHPRTAFGISKDGRYLYLLVVDGRQPGYSLGANLADLNDILLPAGGSDVLNMDGGGSTSLVVFDTDTKTPRMFNRHKNGAIRNVALNLGITFD